MAKNDNGKKEYFISPGVKWVNGEQVKERKSIRLTDRQAQFEIGSGKISLDKSANGMKPQRSPEPPKMPEVE